MQNVTKNMHRNAANYPTPAKNLSALPTINYFNGMTLFVHGVCPYAHRTWIALLEHGAPLTHLVNICHPGLGRTMQPWYIKNINTKETVPSLLLHNSPMTKAKQPHEIKVPQDGFLMLESLQICKFFDKYVHAEENRSLFPDDIFQKNGGKQYLIPAHDEATMRTSEEIITFADEVIIPELYGMLQAPKDKMAKKAVLIKALLKDLEVMFAKPALERSEQKPFFLGDEPSLVDIALVPFLDRFSVTIPYYCKGELDDLFARMPQVRQMYVGFTKRNSFRMSAMPSDYYIRRYYHYTHNAVQVGDSDKDWDENEILMTTSSKEEEEAMKKAKSG